MAEDNNLDLLPLLNLIRGIQAAGSTLAPEPQPDLPNGYSPEQAQRWIVCRKAKIQAAQVPQNVKDKMIASEDVGEGEPVSQPQSQAVRDAMEAEARARAGRRPGTPSTTGAPPQPGRDLPLEFGLQPDNSWGFSKTPPPEPRPAVQQIGYIAPGAVPQDKLAPGYWGSTTDPNDQTGAVTLENVFNATGDKRMEIPVGNPSSLERGALGNPPGAIQPISAADRLQHLLGQLSPQKPDERQNPEDMFTPEQNLARNQAYAKPGPYLTALPPEQEAQFQAWVKTNNVNWKPGDQDYDMRGFWLAQQQGDPLAKSAIDPNDKSLHYPDAFKTPYAATFSNESRYALPVAPQWKGDQYVLPNGHVQYDDVTGQWFEQPGTARTNVQGGLVAPERWQALAPDWATSIIQRESKGKPYIGYDPRGIGVDLSNAPLTKTGAPNWEGREGPAGISTAFGPLQITQSNWDKYAPTLQNKGTSDTLDWRNPETYYAVANAMPRSAWNVGTKKDDSP